MYFKCECTKTCWSDITQYKRDSNALKKKKGGLFFPVTTVLLRLRKPDHVRLLRTVGTSSINSLKR